MTRILRTVTVRHAFQMGHPYKLTTDPDERGVEFDKWLREVKRQTRVDEANRIITLLAAQVPPGAGMRSDGTEDPGMSAFVQGIACSIQEVELRRNSLQEFANGYE